MTFIEYAMFTTIGIIIGAAAGLRVYAWMVHKALK